MTCSITSTLLLCLPLVCLELAGCVSEPAERSPITRAPKVASETVVRIAAIGDVMTHLPQTTFAEIQPDVFDFDFGFQYLAPILRDADVCIANLETTLGGKPWSGYPCFSAPDTLAWALSRAGVDVALMANNHVLDRGRLGLVRTCAVLDRVGLHRTGAFLDSMDAWSHHPLMLDVKGTRIAVVNYSYGTNGIPLRPPSRVNMLDTLAMKEGIRRAKALGADVVIACLHWGQEYRREPHASQREIAAMLIREGVDVILGSHPHVVQPIELNREAPDSVSRVVVYSLGNAISHMKNRYCESGMVVFVDIHKVQDHAPSIGTVKYLPFWVYKGRMQGRWAHVLLPERDLLGTVVPRRIPSDARARMMRELSELRSLLATQSPLVQEWVPSRRDPFLPPSFHGADLTHHLGLVSFTIRKPGGPRS